MAQKVFGSWSMVQLSRRLQRVAKMKQWELFQRVMLVIVLIIWFSTVMTSVFFRLTTVQADSYTGIRISALMIPKLVQPSRGRQPQPVHYRSTRGNLHGSNGDASA